MKQILLGIFLLLTTICMSQKSLETPYQHRMDSTAIANFHITYNEPSNKTYEHDYLLRKVKLTFATRVNTNSLSVFNLNDARDVGDIFNDASTDDYLSIFKYDLSGKFYITRDIRFITRVVLTGTKYTTNQYSCGFYIKF